MNADLVKTGRVRRSPQGQGTLYPVLPSIKFAQQKPVLQVLEDSATSDARVTKTEHEGLANLSQRPITSIKSFESISYAFSFPLCDLLICEFPEFVPNSEQTQTTHPVNIASRYNSLVSDSVQKVSRFVHYVYQKVVRRKPVPYQPSPKNPSYLLCYVEEELECGHKITVHPSSLETLTARKRNCHECSSWFGGLKLPEGKKANASILRSYERIKKQSGKGFWPLTFAAACMIAFGFFLHSLRETGYTYSAPENKFRVLEQINDYDFVLQRVENGLALPPAEFRFCHDYQPLFSPGMTLSWFSYADRGSCQSIKAADKGYILERQNHWPTLAPNCHQDLVNDRVFCNGKPQF